MSGRSTRMYGFFRCGDCRKLWESSQTYTISGLTAPYYKQECKACKSAWEPYKVEPIQCSICGHVDCICTYEEKKKRHVDPTKVHRSDLCEKCKKGYPCHRSD